MLISPSHELCLCHKGLQFERYCNHLNNAAVPIIIAFSAWTSFCSLSSLFFIELLIWMSRQIFSYQSTLKQLFQEFENGGDSNSQLASVTMRIMQALQTNLDGKSKQYRDTSLTHLFLMNNIHYMVRSVRRFVVCTQYPDNLLKSSAAMCAYIILLFRSEAKDLLGDDWVQRHRRIVQQHANQYKRVAWAKVWFFRSHSMFTTKIELICDLLLSLSVFLFLEVLI